MFFFACLAVEKVDGLCVDQNVRRKLNTTQKLSFLIKQVGKFLTKYAQKTAFHCVPISNVCMYRISANSFRGNYSFLEVEVRQLFKGGKLFKGGNYFFFTF